jgi:hypothetical protein
MQDNGEKQTSSPAGNVENAGNGQNGPNADKTGKEGKGENGSPKFDWVTARSACYLPKVFQELRIQVEADVKTRNGLRPNNSPYEFSVVEDGADFIVLLQAKDLRKSVTFSLTEHAILARDDKGDQMLEVTLTFDEQGKCKLHANKQDREMWQIRRMALEELMFRAN